MSLSASPVCQDCWSQLSEQAGTLCVRCGEDLGFSGYSLNPIHKSFEDALCQPCRLAPPAFQRAAAYAVYREEMREAIHLLKYEGMGAIAGRLAPMMARAIALAYAQDQMPARILVVPVPLHSVKRRARGFNQAELLARAALRHAGPLFATTKFDLRPELLQRTRPTESQAGLTPRQRRINLRSAFVTSYPERLVGANVLLMDDIYTTGATARAAAAVLARAGAASVHVATLARAQKEGAVATEFLTGWGKELGAAVQ